MRWFFALNEACTTFPLYADLIRVAVSSARAQTRFSPHFIYDGSPNALTDWLGRQGVCILQHRTSFYAELRALSEARNDPDIFRIGTGAFLRVELPDLLRQRGWSDERVLYTDCDVMFVGDPEPELSRAACARFAVAPEFDRGNYDRINTGVMLMNVPALQRDREPFARFIRGNLERLVTNSWDQEAYRLFYKRKLPLLRNRWDKLPPTLNWKPYWGENGAATIVHFHGPKPFQEEMVRAGKGPATLLPLATPSYFAYCQRWRSYLRLTSSPPPASRGTP